MNRHRGVLARLWRWSWLLGAWWAARRMLPARPVDVQRQLYRTQTRGMGLRMTEWLRDRLRPGWLRLRRGGAGPDGE